MYYDTENKIPLDTQWVSKRLRLATQVVDDVLQDMFIRHEDGWFHARCDDVIQQYHAMAEKNRANGRLGGRKKNPVGNQMETHSEPIAKATNNHKPETINQELKEKRESPYQALFDIFWGKYPKKVGKDAALRAFVKRKPDQHLLTQMLNAIGEQIRSESWTKGFVPNPATWLNEGRWQDEVAVGQKVIDKQESFYEREQRANAERMSEFTPHTSQRVVKRIDPQTGFFIDETGVTNVNAIASC
jgi:uncharacterized protein YdaU (DUF1376 family)